MRLATFCAVLVKVSLPYVMHYALGRLNFMVMEMLMRHMPSLAMYGTKVKVRARFPLPTKVTVHKHNAERAGLHYDFRFRYSPLLNKKFQRLISYAVKKRPPSHSSRLYSTLFIRQNDHVVNYEKFSGTIKSGYGKGTVSIDYQSPGIIWTKNDVVNILTPYNTSPWSGYWKLIPKGSQIIAVRIPAFTPVWIPRVKYSSIPDISPEIGKLLKTGEQPVIAERKVDGANFMAYVRSPGLEKGAPEDIEYENVKAPPNYTYRQGDGPFLVEFDMPRMRALWRAYQLYGNGEKGFPVTVSYISRRQSVDGGPIVRSEVLPHISFWTLPDELKELLGTLFRVELWHPKGVNILSGMLNSLPENGLQAQNEHGHIRAMFFDIEGIITPIKKIFIPSSSPYISRANTLKELVKFLNGGHIGYPRSRYTYSIPDRVIGNTTRISEFYNKVIEDPMPLGEGVVIKPISGVSRTPWLKVKRTHEFDLEVKDVLEGTGKYENSMGKLVLADRTGHIVAKVGTGFSDEEREAYWNNRSNIPGTIVTIKAQDIAKEALRAPVFIRERPDKSPLDTDIVVLKDGEEQIKDYLRGQGIPEPEVENTLYALKVSAGWSRK